MLDLASQVCQAVNAAPEPQHIVIAGFASAIQALVIPLLTSGGTTGMTFEVREAEDEIALRDLRLGHVDIVFVQEYDGAPIARSQRLDYTLLLRDRLRPLAPPTFSPGVGLADLASIGWLVNGAGTRCEEATQRILQNANIMPSITGHATRVALAAVSTDIASP